MFIPKIDYFLMKISKLLLFFYKIANFLKDKTKIKQGHRNFLKYVFYLKELYLKFYFNKKKK